eukprot:TRINITY_DN4156_c0_g1_i5.p1 TRINITY_DN4156_c0_g1~~TRINITY_DN4156_c0_g1_i5.p1  ORF type:complete len:735 (-),score=77.11 TRINITY_DN4156_c0_g1_i5:2507-4711(-)
MIDARLQRPHHTENCSDLQLPTISSRELAPLISWAEACLQEMEAHGVTHLSDMEAIPAPSLFVDVSFPMESALLDRIAGGVTHETPGVLIHLYARVFAHVGVVSSNRLRAAFDAIPQSECAWDGFFEGLQEIYTQDPATVCDVFRELATQYVDDPTTIGVGQAEREHYIGEVERFRQAKSMLDVLASYQGHSYMHPYYSGAALFSYALQLDLYLGMELLETARMPDLCKFVFSSPHVQYDRDILLTLLEKAPAFEGASESAPVSGFLAPLLVEYYILHVERIAETYSLGPGRGQDSPALVQFINKEAPLLFQRATEVMLDRPDAKVLACSWLCDLMGSFQRPAPRQAWDAREVFWDILAGQMTDHSYSLDIFKEELGWSFPDDSALVQGQEVGKAISHPKMPALHELAAALGVVSDLHAESPGILHMITSALYSSKSGLYCATDPRFTSSQLTKQDYTLGAVIAHSPKPTESWSELWAAMASVRNRLRHAPFEREAVPDDAHRYLPILGIAAFDWLYDVTERDYKELKALWRSLWEAVYSTWLNAMETEREAWAQYLHWLIVRRTLLSGDSDEQRAEDLRGYLQKLSYSPMLVATIGCNLKLNVSPETIELLRDDLEPLVSAFLQSEDERIVKQLTHPALAEACRKLYTQRVVVGGITQGYMLLDEGDLLASSMVSSACSLPVKQDQRKLEISGKRFPRRKRCGNLDLRKVRSSRFSRKSKAVARWLMSAANTV